MPNSDDKTNSIILTIIDFQVAVLGLNGLKLYKQYNQLSSVLMSILLISTVKIS